MKTLTDYRGFLQVDAAPACDDVFAQHPEIIEVGCWAHARRHFKEAMPTAAVVCAQVLALVGQFYGIERAANDRRLDASARQRLFVYLRDVIERVPTHPVRPVLQLTPREWKRLRKDTNKQAAA